MVDVKIFNVFAGDDIDLIIPFVIQWLKRSELFNLLLAELWKIMLNDCGLFVGHVSIPR